MELSSTVGFVMTIFRLVSGLLFAMAVSCANPVVDQAGGPPQPEKKAIVLTSSEFVNEFAIAYSRDYLFGIETGMVAQPWFEGEAIDLAKFEAMLAEAEDFRKESDAHLQSLHPASAACENFRTLYFSGRRSKITIDLIVNAMREANPATKESIEALVLEIEQSGILEELSNRQVELSEAAKDCGFDWVAAIQPGAKD